LARPLDLLSLQKDVMGKKLIIQQVLSILVITVIVEKVY
jgi:hypothetical protein